MTDDIYTAKQLIDELQDLPPDTPIMLCVVKYPDQFRLKRDVDSNEWRWDNGSDTEQHPLTETELIDGLLYLTVELTEFNPERAQMIS